MRLLKPIVCSLPFIGAAFMTHLEPAVFMLCYFLTAGFSGGILLGGHKTKGDAFRVNDAAWALCWPLLWCGAIKTLVYSEEIEGSE